MPWAFGFRALSGTFYLHTALLTLAIWAAPWAARWAVSIANTDRAVGPVPAFGLWMAQGGLVGAMLVLSLIYLRGQTAFIYFQF